ncbi:MAG TPA: hypothetical protein VEM35_06345, partial [Rhizomicrobium sp.]|nr:hypothetical protein [Rhizomicrobium sp.]
MGKKPAKPNIPRRRAPGAATRAAPAAPRRKSRATWPYVLALLAGWGLIFGGIFLSHLVSNLPDV